MHQGSYWTVLVKERWKWSSGSELGKRRCNVCADAWVRNVTEHLWKNVSTWFISHIAKFSFGIRSLSFGRYIQYTCTSAFSAFSCAFLHLSCRCNKLPQPSSLREEEVTVADSLRMGTSWRQELEAAGHIVHATRIQIRMDAHAQLFMQSRTLSLCLNAL